MFVRTALFMSACAVLFAGLVVLGVKLAGPAPQPTPMAAASSSPTPTKLPKAFGLLLIAESSGHRRLPDISATSAWAAAQAAIRTGLAGPSRSLAGWWRLKPDASDDGVILFARKTVGETPTVPTVPVLSATKSVSLG